MMIFRTLIEIEEGKGDGLVQYAEFWGDGHETAKFLAERAKGIKREMALVQEREMMKDQPDLWGKTNE